MYYGDIQLGSAFTFYFSVCNAAGAAGSLSAMATATEKADSGDMKQIQNEKNYKITIRYNATITPQHRIKWGSRIFDVNSVINIDERNREMTLSATEAE